MRGFLRIKPVMIAAAMTGIVMRASSLKYDAAC
jgi:hypothetical protein